MDTTEFRMAVLEALSSDDRRDSSMVWHLFRVLERTQHNEEFWAFVHALWVNGDKPSKAMLTASAAFLNYSDRFKHKPDIAYAVHLAIETVNSNVLHGIDERVGFWG